MSYPEHDKLEKVANLSQGIGEFLETSHYQLCEWSEEANEFFPASRSIIQILADYFNIDLDKLEDEKNHMLETLRKLQ